VLGTGLGAADQMCETHAIYKYSITDKHLHLRRRWQGAEHPICISREIARSAAANLSQSQRGL
jgi:hypothetical protein